MSRPGCVAAGGLLMALLLVACDRKDTVPPASPPQPVVDEQRSPPVSGEVASAPRAEQWLGRWMGPEATYLEIIQAGGAYTIHIRNLDGVRTFPAEPIEDGLGFQRDGVPEFIRATDGKGTGMKWLADKSDCLGIRPGEGYCRG